MGKEAFLSRYGFGSAKGYLLIVDCREYDSKAIAGVAYGYQYRNEGALKHREFSGGITRRAAASQLKALGFEILSIEKKAAPRGTL